MRLVLAALFAFGAMGPASAIDGNAVALRDGPKGGRFIGPVWMMKCTAGQRLAGIRVHQDKRIAGIEALCVKPADARQGFAWSSRPKLTPAPRRKTVDTTPTYVDDEGRLLDGQSELSDGGASRIAIVEEQDWRDPALEAASHSPMGYDVPGPDAVAVTDEAVYRPEAEDPPENAENIFETDYARTTWAGTPFLWRYDRGVYRGAIAFRKVRGSYDIVCPANAYVTGIRSGWERGEGSDRLSAIRLACGVPGGRDRTLVGDWPQPRKRKHGKPAVLREQRSDCTGAAANPLDGDAVQSIFGAIEDGRVQTIGVSCIAWQEPRPMTTAAAAP